MRSAFVLLATMALASTAHADDVVAEDRAPVVAFVPSVGMVAYGRGGQEMSCSGGCAGFAATSSSYTHRPAAAFGADVLFGATRYLRLGPSFRYTAATRVDVEGVSTFDVGNDWTLDGVVEGFFPLGPRTGIAPRLRAGLLALSAGGDLKDYLGELRDEFCDPLLGCGIASGVRFGWNAGVGIGGWLRVAERLRLRLDLDVQYYSVVLYTLNSRLAGSDIEVSESLSGARLYLTLGAELF